jgi:hypothetical protein
MTVLGNQFTIIEDVRPENMRLKLGLPDLINRGFY